jgi:PAS domain S-box-containing protein
MRSEAATAPDLQPPPSQQAHAVQFYEDEAFLAETVAQFMGRGIVADEPVVVIATASHREAFCEQLRRKRIDVDALCTSGQVTLLDARETLAKFMVDGAPDWARFSAVVGDILDRVRVGREDRTIRAYGEMVDLLWRDGNRDAAIRLEELWNDLGKLHSFDLLCAYVMDNFYKETDSEEFARICHVHTHARPAERYATIADDVTRQRELAILHQRALALHNEVEERKKIESELRRSEQRLREFVEDAVVPLHWVDGNGIIIWANKAELQMLGYSREEYVGQPIMKFHADADVIDDILARLGRREILREYPSRLICKDGSIRHVLIDSHVRTENDKFAHTCCFTRDITARMQAEEAARQQEAIVRDFTRQRQAEEKLRQSELRLRLLIENIRDYAIFMLDGSGNVATWNPGAERITGYAASEMIGRHFSTFYPEEDVRAGKCEMELRVAGETGRFEDIGWRVRKDGTRYWANVIISAVRDERGQLVGFAKVTRDLTERKQAEDERAARIAAEEANRAKDEFLAMLGHELRNPLAPIVTALQLMKLRGDVSSSKEQFVIERQVQHVTRLVDDLLDMSRIAQKKIELKTETFELATVVAKAVETASPLIEQRRHSLSVEVPRQGMPVTADPIRLAQVIANLLTNAAKYTEPEGRVELSAWRDGHEVVIQVKDNGIGIRENLLPKVFDLFVQGPRSIDRGEGGLGIGLTLVKNIAQMHGGSVVALSDGLGKGSAFVVRLPAATSKAMTDSPAPQPSIDKVATPRCVLVVDDNADAALLLAELCEIVGHEVKVAYDGPQALKLLDEGFQPDVAVLDIGLPVMDGYDLATRVREKLGSSCRLFALTGYGQEHDKQRSIAVGFEAHLVKPVDPSRVLGLIDRPAR